MDGEYLMKFTYFVLLVLTFPYWFVPVAVFFLSIGMLWMIGYPIACTVHLIYFKLRYGKWTHWQLIAPGK